MEVGDRVISVNGDIGYIESIDGEFADVRYLTPDNELSCCVGLFFIEHLRLIGDNVVPMPKSESWWKESAALYSAIKEILDG